MAGLETPDEGEIVVNGQVVFSSRQGVWLPPEKRKLARDMVLRNGANGLRRPVQVIAGNHELMPGVCPWWDETMRKA